MGRFDQRRDGARLGRPLRHLTPAAGASLQRVEYVPGRAQLLEVAGAVEVRAERAQAEVRGSEVFPRLEVADPLVGLATDEADRAFNADLGRVAAIGGGAIKGAGCIETFGAIC